MVVCHSESKVCRKSGTVRTVSERYKSVVNQFLRVTVIVTVRWNSGTVAKCHSSSNSSEVGNSRTVEEWNSNS